MPARRTASSGVKRTSVKRTSVKRTSVKRTSVKRTSADAGAATPPALAEYQRKRDFTKTAEPSGAEPRGAKAGRGQSGVRGARGARGARFVIQKHAASSLHFDFRLEIGGVMKSWAVPKGPSLDPAVKRLAMEVEDHPVSYNTFEGTIPRGQYGGGTVMLWDRGHFRGAGGEDDAALAAAYEGGRLDIVMEGERLRGGFTLVRTRGRGGKPQWLLMKRRDEHAAEGSDVTADETTSVATGRTMEEIGGGPPPTPTSRRLATKASSGARTSKPRVARRGAATGSATKNAASAGGPPPRAISPRNGKAPSPSTRTAKPRAAPRAAPTSLEPMYASIGTTVPEGDGWTFEPKYDGIRVLAFATPTAVQLVTRNGKDKATQFPEVSDALRALATRARRALVLDGEIVALVDGQPARFQALQGRMHVKDAEEVAGHAEATPASLVAFDVLVDGDDILLAEPWTARRARLVKLLRAPLRGRLAPRLLLGETEPGDGAALVAHARERGWEGVIAKRVDATYSPGRRAAHWLKLKVEHRQEFVVGGWTEPRNTRQYLGALLLGHYDEDGQLVYVGHAGGGFTREGLADMARRLEPLARKTSPFATPVHTNETAHWVRPEVVVEVKFIEWTSDGRLRQPIVLGPRDDKEAREVTREADSVQSARAIAKAVTRKSVGKGAGKNVGSAAPGTAAKSAAATSATRAAGTRATTAEKLARIEEAGGEGTVTFGRGLAVDVSNLGKVFFPGDGYTKGDVMRYYATVAPQILPVVADRPLVLRRFPNGIEGKAFYQHDVPDPPHGVRTAAVDVDGDGEFKRFLIGGDLATILYSVQLGAVSVDPFHGRLGALDTADYTIVDLDPGPKAPFTRVVEVATWVKAELDALGLTGALKTSGSTGLHIALPLPRGTSAESALLLAQLVATRVAAAHPREATVERAVKARKADAVYVDYLQNIPGKTVAAAYAARAKPGATVSTPLAWKELTPKLDPSAFTIRTVPERIAKVGDLWAEAMRKPNSTKALAAAAGKA